MKFKMSVSTTYTGKTPAQMAKEYKRFIDNLPTLVGNEAVKFFKEKFRTHEWNGVQWQKRDPDKRPGGALLLDAGDLRDSIRVITTTANSVTIGTDVPYAQAHNEGFTGAVTIPAHTRSKREKFKSKFSNLKTRKTRTQTLTIKVGETIVKAHVRNMNIPQRQFMGASEFLFKRINLIVQQR